MSRSYDDRIVRMGFENAKFESGAKQTISTLDKLNEKLKLKGATEGSENIQKSVDSVDFSSMERAILNIEKRFSTLGIVGMNVINKITNGIAGSVARLEQMTIGQIKSGGWARAMNIANAKFQIEGLGFAWEEVEKAVSYGVKDTAYGLDAAASAASQLAASGVDFKKVLDTVNGQELTAMHKSLRAISGVAAMTNSSYEDIARIFTTVAGNGRLMGDQLLQLSSRGMNAAAKLAETLGTTEGEIREMVSRGQIDFQTFAFAMDNAFGDHAKEANKTFTGALGNMKAALSRVGEIFADPIINKTNTLFISLTTRIDEFKNKLKSIKVPRTLEEIEKRYHGISNNATAYEATLKGMGDRTIKLGEDFAKMWQSGIDAFSAMIKSVDLEWFDKVVEHVDETVNKITEFFDLLKDIYGESAEEAADSIEDATAKLVVSAEEAQAARDIIDKGMYGSGDARKNALTELFGGGDEGKKHAENVQAYIDSVIAAGWSYEKAAIQVAQANEEVAESQEDSAREAKKARLKKILDEISTSMSNLWTTAKNLGKAAKKIATAIFDAFAAVFKIDFGKMTEGVSGFTGLLAKLSEKLIISDDTAERVTSVFTTLFSAIKAGGTIIVGAGKKAWEFVQTIGNTKIFKNAKESIDGLFTQVKDFAKSDFFSTITDKISGFFDSLSFGNIGKSVDDFFSGMKEYFDGVELPKSIKDNDFFKSVNTFIDNAKAILSEDSSIPEKIGNLLNNIFETIKNVNVVDAGKLALTVWGIVSIARIFFLLDDIGDALESVSKIPQKISTLIGNLGTMFSNFGLAALNSSKALVIKAAATAILEIIGSLIIISQIPADDIYRAASVLVVIVAALAVLMKLIGRTTKMNISIKASLISLTQFSANIIAVASLIGAIGGAMILFATAMSIVNKNQKENGNDGNSEFYKLLGWMFGAMASLVAMGAILKKEYVRATSILETFVGMSLLISSFGASIFAVASAMAVIAVLPSGGVQRALETVATMMFSIIAIFSILGTVKVSPGQLVASAAAMVGFAGAMTLLVGAIAAIAILPQNDRILEAVKALVGVTLVLMGGIAVMSKMFSGGLNKAAGLIVGVLAVQLLMGSLIAALTAITAIAAKNPEALAQAATTITTLVIIAGLVSAVLAAGAVLSGGGSGGKKSSDGIFAMGAAFIMVAGGIYIFAKALEILTAVASDSNFGAAIAMLVGFVVVVGALSVAAAVFPTVLIPAFNAVGKVLLYAGAGFALMGASVLLVCTGITKLAPSIRIMAENLRFLFTVMEEHKGATAAILIVVTVAIVALTIAITKLAPVLQGIGSLLTAVASRVGGTLKKGASGLKKWVSNLSTKGKTAIVAVITTLCAAILKASPTLLDTVGQLLIKLLAYLGKIAGDLALGLVDFLINLINGLADAIRVNSARIAAALWGVVISLGDLLIQILGRLLTFLLNGIGLGSAADWITDKISKISEALNEYAMEERRIAEDADKSKRDYNESIKNAANVTEEANKKSIASLDSLSNAFKKDFDDSGNQVDKFGEKYDTLMNKVWANDYSGAKMPALDKAGDNTNELMTRVWDSAGNAAPEQSPDEVLSENGWGTQDYAEAGEERGSAYSDECAESMFDGDEYYKASTENMDASQQAIIDSKEDTKKAIQTSFNEPAKAQIRASHQGMYDAARYSVEGAIKYIENEGTVRYRSAMVFLARSAQEEFIIANRINSPSKEYYEYAKYIVMGLVNGLTQNTDQASNAMGSLSDAILASFTDPIDYVSRIASGELVYDPSIRPVFDSSGLYKGASSINSMIRGQTVTVAGLSGRIAADIGTLDHSNADIISELQAMRADIASLGDEMADMQIVMDTGALVGATAPSMDRALGRRAIYKGRGN